MNNKDTHILPEYDQTPEGKEPARQTAGIRQTGGKLHPEMMGAAVTGNGIHFSVEAPENKPPVLLIYTKQSPEPIASIPFPPENRFGKVYTMIVRGIRPERHFYAFSSGGRIFCDPYARLVLGREKFGDAGHLNHILKAGFLTETFDWEGDRPLEKTLDELVIYRLHIRGFTAHPSSHVKGRGTFFGLIQKIPYLKELGVTAVELMPVTEFEEVLSALLPPADRKNRRHDLVPMPTGRVNYWGYAPSFLLAPKAAYHSHLDGRNQSQELKALIKALHQNQIEIIFELYFPPETSEMQMLEVLRFWAVEYHADGLHISGRTSCPAAAQDPILSSVKLFAADWGDTPKGDIRHLIRYHDGFLVDMRRFLKGDEGQLKAAVFRIRQNPEDMATVNYMAHSNGFTLYDMVSYDQKHNEDNGEQNHDGTDFNHSWNCGVEGDTRSRTIARLRKNQLRNALVMLFLSQGIPLLEAGDECGHSKKGNNNTYCQDNDLSWMNWRHTRNGDEIRQFIIYLIRLRREHPIFRGKTSMNATGSQNRGFPPVSFHGTNPWKPEFGSCFRQLGVLYNESGANPLEKHMFYIIYNMHWTDQDFSLPHPPVKNRWSLLIHTTGGDPGYYLPEEAPLLEECKTLTVPARTVILLMSRTDLEKQTTDKQD